MSKDGKKKTSRVLEEELKEQEQKAGRELFRQQLADDAERKRIRETAHPSLKKKRVRLPCDPRYFFVTPLSTLIGKIGFSLGIPAMVLFTKSCVHYFPLSPTSAFFLSSLNNGALVASCILTVPLFRKKNHVLKMGAAVALGSLALFARFSWFNEIAFLVGSVVHYLAFLGIISTMLQQAADRKWKIFAAIGGLCALSLGVIGALDANQLH